MCNVFMCLSIHRPIIFLYLPIHLSNPIFRFFIYSTYPIYLSIYFSSCLPMKFVELSSGPAACLCEMIFLASSQPDVATGDGGAPADPQHQKRPTSMGLAYRHAWTPLSTASSQISNNKKCRANTAKIVLM